MKFYIIYFNHSNNFFFVAEAELESQQYQQYKEQRKMGALRHVGTAGVYFLGLSTEVSHFFNRPFRFEICEPDHYYDAALHYSLN